MQKFSGEGDTLPRPHSRLRRLDLRAYGVQAQRDTPRKNPSYGLVVVVSRHQQTPPLTASDNCHNLRDRGPANNT